MFPTYSLAGLHLRLQTLRRTALYLVALALALIAAPAAARAQTATVFGSLSNFDVVNNTEHEAHGFEIELEGLQAGDVYYSFSAQRYGAAQIVPYATGVRVRWTSAYDPGMQQFMQTTITHAPNSPFGGSCYQWGANYAASGCEHFGVSLRANAVKTTYRWLIEDATAPGSLTPFDPPVAIPGPVYIVLPPAQPAEPPVLEAVIEAPEPPEAPEQFGNAQWVKVFKTELQREVTLDELMSDNAVVPQDAAHAEVAWEILQADPPSNSNGNRRRGRQQNQGALSAGTRAVIRRYEMYQYTGAYDPVTHEALCADTLCNAPADGEVGDLIGAQMAAANVGVPSVTVSLAGGGKVSSSDRIISCGSKCAASYDMNAQVTLTASPNSGSVFTGWSGACTGAQSSCTLSVNDALNVTANFAPLFNLTVKDAGSGSVASAPAAIDCGKTCTAKLAQGTRLTLTATPATGVKFTGWSGACSGTSLTCSVVMSKDTQVQANFK
ncbi:MAG: hypothetical protein QOJ70_3860 [Acidobacteriota bacterium]|jgi:hypothetical protein|nr:hypothetical protein [Acidobacteriota bacterium]MDT7810047.1 hypothetical protein [Acidobacteriota bacterium]